MKPLRLLANIAAISFAGTSNPVFALAGDPEVEVLRAEVAALKEQLAAISAKVDAAAEHDKKIAVVPEVKWKGGPETSASERVRVVPLGSGFWRVVASYGFMQSPNMPQVLEIVDQMGIRCKPMETSYFLGRERLIPCAGRPGEPFSLPRWRKVLFAVMTRNARSATEFFAIPPNRVVELGTQIEF